MVLNKWSAGWGWDWQLHGSIWSEPRQKVIGHSLLQGMPTCWNSVNMYNTVHMETTSKHITACDSDELWRKWWAYYNILFRILYVDWIYVKLCVDWMKRWKEGWHASPHIMELHYTGTTASSCGATFSLNLFHYLTKSDQSSSRVLRYIWGGKRCHAMCFKPMHL